MTRPRDFQRSRVYSCENGFKTNRIPNEELATVQAYVDAVTSSKWWRRMGGQPYVRVYDGRGRRRASAYCATNSIKMPRWSRYEGCVLHELAHLLVPTDVPSHGREFTATFLVLVRHCMGQEAYRDLRDRFRQGGVKMGTMPKPA